MKKLFLIFILLLLSACSIINTDRTSIQTPEVAKPPIYGKWTISKYINTYKTNDDNFQYKDIIGSDVLFASDEAMVSGDYIINPSYRTKRVNVDEYLYKKYNLNYKNLNIENKDAFAISLKQKDFTNYEIIKVSDDTAFIIRNNFIFQISKTDDDLTEDQLKVDISRNREDSSGLTIENLSDKADIGLMLGLKEPNQSKLPSFNYKTLYIKFYPEGVENVYESPNILLPRKDGFYQVEIQRVSKKDEISDNLLIKKRVDPLNDRQAKEKIYQIEDNNILKNINFISEDIINIENISVEKNLRKLRIYDINNIEKKEPLQIAYFISSDDNKELIKETNDKLKDNDNIGIYRENGYWKLKGRNNSSNGYFIKDFDLNIVLPNSINKYNVLNIPMTDLKKFNSKIKDAFISPDNKYLITLENTMLKIYNIGNGNIISNAIFEREIGQDTSVIMSQWSMGRYSKLWQKEITRKN